MSRSRCPALAAVFLVAAALFASLAAGDGPGSRELGKKIYRDHCLECHGKQGRGDGPKALRLGFRPRDFTLGSFKCRCTPTGRLPRDEDLMRVVERGLPGTVMKGFAATLSEVERLNVIEYIKGLSPVFAGDPAPPCLEVPSPVAASDETVAAGKQIYRLLRCWTCHGVDGDGDGPAAKTLLDDWGDRIRVYNFTRPNRFKCGGEDRALYILLQTGLAGSPMPSYSTALRFSSDDVGDLGTLSAVFDVAELDGLSAYLNEQPNSASLESMADDERQALADQRAWALIHYLRSLVAP